MLLNQANLADVSHRLMGLWPKLSARTYVLYQILKVEAMLYRKITKNEGC